MLSDLTNLCNECPMIVSVCLIFHTECPRGNADAGVE